MCLKSRLRRLLTDRPARNGWRGMERGDDWKTRREMGAGDRAGNRAGDGSGQMEVVGAVLVCVLFHKSITQKFCRVNDSF